MKIIEFKETSFHYKNGLGFYNFNMEIEEGKIVSLIGPNGSGKTTLLKMICHQLPNESILYMEKRINEIPVDELKKNVVVVFNKPFNEITIHSELMHYVKESNIKYQDGRKRALEFIKTFELEEYLKEPIDKLPLNIKNLIKILRFLIMKPKFIAIDGLLSGLDTENKNKIIDYIRKNKITLLNVTCDINDTLIGDEIYIIEDFVIILEGKTNSVLKADTLLKRLGYTLPVAAELSIELNNYNVLNKIYINDEELVDKLWK